MKKCLLPAAALLAMAPVHAQTQVSVYGVLDLGLVAKQFSGQPRLKAVESGLMETSHLGFRGSEDLGGGLKANFDLASFLRMDTGESTRGIPSEAFWSRSAWVGLSGSWGSVRMGRISTPNFLTTLRYNPFGGSPQFNTSFLHNYLGSATQPQATGSGATDSAWSNAVAYGSPVLGGLSLGLQWAPSESGTAGRRLGYALNYSAGDFAMTLSGDRTRDASLNFPLGIPSQAGALPPFTGQNFDTWQLGASHDFKLFKLMGQLVHTEVDGTQPGPVSAQDLTMRTLQLGVSAPLGSGKLMASVARTSLNRSTGSDSARRTVVLGYSHELSKRTDLYGLLMHDQVSQLDAGTTPAVGLRHRF